MDGSATKPQKLFTDADLRKAIAEVDALWMAEIDKIDRQFTDILDEMAEACELHDSLWYPRLVLSCVATAILTLAVAGRMHG